MDAHARISDLKLVDSLAENCTYRLLDDETMHPSFPFAFTLGVTYTLNDRTLSTIVKVTNRDNRKMQFCAGFHPAFP